MTDHTRTEKIGGDSIFIFVVFQVERETVMTMFILWTYQIRNPNIIKCIFQYIGEYTVIKYLLRL